MSVPGGGDPQLNKFEQAFSGDRQMSLAGGPQVNKLGQVFSGGHQISLAGGMSDVGEGPLYSVVQCMGNGSHGAPS